MRPAFSCSARAALGTAITILALAGCNALLGIEEYRLGPDAAPPTDAPRDAPTDGMPTDGMQTDGMPADGMPAVPYPGYPNDLGEDANIPGNYLWAVPISVSQAVTLDKLGFLSRNTSAGSALKLALYAEDPGMAGRPGARLVEIEGIAVVDGVNEIDVTDTSLSPGTYWFAMLSEAGIDLGSGPPDITHHYFYLEYPNPMPATFPDAAGSLESALNVYLVVKP